MKKKGFTLIELLAVLVVLAILALITIPLVIGIIKNARVKSHQRSIVNYGRTVETAVGVYLLDHDITLPSNISLNDLKIHTSGEEVICDDIVNIKADGKISLTNCYVSGTDEKYNYDNRKLTKVSTNDTSTNSSTTYNAYSVGDTFTLNGDSYHIIADSGVSQDYVVALKDTPLTTSQVETYGVGHINRYSANSNNTVYNIDGYGAVVFYSSEACGYKNSRWQYTGCTTSYKDSDVKYIVDEWEKDKFTNELKKVSDYTTRFLRLDELLSFGYEWFDNGSTSFWQSTESTPEWLYNGNYYYWTMSPKDDSSNVEWVVSTGSAAGLFSEYEYVMVGRSVCNSPGTIRPVINVYKDKLPE